MENRPGHGATIQVGTWQNNDAFRLRYAYWAPY